MENHILVGKRFELEKLKEHNLRIPVTLNPFKSVVSINLLTEENVLPLKLELIFANAGLTTYLEKNITIPLELNQKLNQLTLKDLNIFTCEGNYLLHGLRSNKKVTIEFSLTCNN